jgi:hypothetical protein
MSTPAPPDNAPAEPSSQPANPPAPEGTPAPTPPEPTAPATPAPSEPVTEPKAAEPKAKAPKFEGDFDPERAMRAIENLRKEVDDQKQKRKDDQDTLMKRVAKAFGLETDEDKPPTPEELAQQLEEAQNRTKASDDRARQTQVELAVYKTAGKHGGDPDALLDSRSFAKAIAKLDPTAADFDDQVGKAVKQAVDGNKKLAAKAPEPKEPDPTPAGGAPMDGAPGGKRQLGAADVARMTPEQIDQAVKDGRLKSYLGG